MTEYEINKTVAEKLGIMQYMFDGKDSESIIWNAPSNNLYNGFVSSRGNLFDPCNNAQQAWEIMIANDIGITKCLRSDNYCAYRGLWGEGESFNPEHLTCNSEFFFNSKPFVAAMLLFLEI